MLRQDYATEPDVEYCEEKVEDKRNRNGNAVFKSPNSTLFCRFLHNSIFLFKHGAYLTVSHCVLFFSINVKAAVS